MKEENIIFISSTDLTHYGFRFGYTPKGTDQNALRWVKQEKDPGFINLIKNKKYKEIINYSSEHNSACGAGGVALITGILRNKKINLEEYTTSADEYPNSGTDSFVTYAGISFEEK
jgi:AmmeMemoRadiSam system protein B